MIDDVPQGVLDVQAVVGVGEVDGYQLYLDILAHYLILAVI